MELVNINDESFFDPTPKLNSSPVPILFVSFNDNDKNCIHCGDKYTETIICYQKYCKKCLSSYITEITDNKIYLDVYIHTRNLECSEHEISRINEPQNVQECCRNCLEILYFKQLPVFIYYFGHSDYGTPDTYYNNLYYNMIESEKYCELCGKSLYQGTDKNIIVDFKLCSDCYLISTGSIESTLTKKPIPIIYLPWWDTTDKCCACKLKLKFTSDCQKYCSYCFIFYTGCRYCLTTNIIFGFTNQSQCKKCKRVLLIISPSGNSDLDDFLVNLRLDYYNNLITKFTYKIKNVDKYLNPYDILGFTYDGTESIFMELIPYSQFTNVKEIARGGFGIIYQATWLDGSIDDNDNQKVGTRIIRRRIREILRRRRSNETVILKRFKNSQDISKYFLNELKSNQQCYKINHHIIKIYGFTKDPKFDDYILVMQYASGGDLHNFLQENFREITWNKPRKKSILSILLQISDGLETIHKAGFIHRDFHSGNILFDLSNGKRHQCQIGDLGLSQPANNTSSNNDIYGVIPYIAPEIFKGSAFSKKSDVYCVGMIMWELTTGCKPFSNVEHDINLILKILDGERPKITEDTPECYANLMKKCWDSNPEKRPSMNEIRRTFNKWSSRSHKTEDNKQFDQVEIKRKELIESGKLGPKKPHPKAIYTSRPLSSFISQCSSIDSSSKDYTSIELELDIDIKSRPNVLGTNKRNIEELNIHPHENNGKRIKS